MPENTSLPDGTVSYVGGTRSGDTEDSQTDKTLTQTDMDLPDGVTFVSADMGQENQHLPAVRHFAPDSKYAPTRLTGRAAGTGTCGWPLD